MTQPLNYESRATATTRPAWVYVVGGIYVSILLGLITAGVILSWNNAPESDRVWKAPLTAAVVIVPFLVGGGLLVLVPIRVQRGRNITRRSIWIPLLGAAVLLAILCFGAAIAWIEFVEAHNGDNPLAILIFEILGAIWLAWMLLFWLISRSLDPLSLSSVLYKSLLAGSVVELLVAVPMHIVVRRRTECCAGIYTGTAICLGAITALVALGPGVYFLYYRRWKQTHGNPASTK